MTKGETACGGTKLEAGQICWGKGQWGTKSVSEELSPKTHHTSAK